MNDIYIYLLLISTTTTHLKTDVWEENTMCALIADLSISYVRLERTLNFK
jgi:hypothetical protein